MKGNAEVIEWLMEGDAVIRWQVMRDLLKAPEKAWKAEQKKVATSGWGKAFLSYQKADGSWKARRWTETIWVLLMLLDCGVSTDLESLRKATDDKISTLLPRGEAADLKVLKTRQDLCHVGFWLRIGSAFMPEDVRLKGMVTTIFDLQMDDGGWNCQIRNYPDKTHSSFNTTFNVLEGLREAARAGVVTKAKFKQAEDRAMEFMLMHRLYKSDKTGKVVQERMTQLTFPWHWHYTVLRGLDYMRETKHIKDARLADAIELIESKRKPNGRWPVEKRIPGIMYFDMEAPGSDSRWNTLRALRVLNARG